MCLRLATRSSSPLVELRATSARFVVPRSCIHSLTSMAALAMLSVLLHAACFDKENGCESWAEGGECEKNAVFMKEACPQACKICTPPPPIDEHDDPLLGRERAVMTTEYGEIVLGFYPTVAPKTVAHIIKLFRMGGYDTNHVFRVDKGFVAQVQGVDGGRRATMSKALRHEAKKNVPDEFSGTPGSAFPDLKHVRGMLSMGKFEEPGSGTSSFSMLLGKSPSLDGKYTIFGRVVSGDQARAHTCPPPTALGEDGLLGVAGAQPHGGSGDKARGHLRHAQGACTLHAHYMHITCTLHAHYTCTCTACAPHVHCMCTACALHVHRMCTACALHVHRMCMCTACALHVHCMCTACALHAHCVFVMPQGADRGPLYLGHDLVHGAAGRRASGCRRAHPRP